MLYRLIHVEYNFDKKDFLSLFLEVFPIDLKRYIDACFSGEKLSAKLVQVGQLANHYSSYIQIYPIFIFESYIYQLLCAIDYLHRRAIVSFFFIQVEKSATRSFRIHTRSCRINEILYESDKNSSSLKSYIRSYYIFVQGCYIHFICTNNL